MDLTHATTQKSTQKPTRNSHTELSAQLGAQLASLELTPQARTWASQLLSQLQTQQAQLHAVELKNQSLVMELAHVRRMRFGAKSEAMSQINWDLFDESSGADIGALNAEIDGLQKSAGAQLNNNDAANNVANTTKAARTHAGRQALPAHLPRIEHRHDTHTDGVNKGKPLSACGCNTCGAILSLIGEDVSEQLDVTPATFFVHRHIRPQYACRACETVTAAAVPAAVIDGGLAAPGLISWVLTSKFADHLPLYRLEQIAARQNVPLARSTLAEWVGRYGFALQPLVDRLQILLKQSVVLHADETPVQQLAPGTGKTHRAYLWAYCTGALVDCAPNDERHPIVVFDYQSGRSGAHARGFLHGWGGHLMVDDYVGYKALFVANAAQTSIANSVANSVANSAETAAPIIELGCMAHARRKFFELHAANGSPVAAQALARIGTLYEIERRGRALSVDERFTLRQSEAAPLLADMKLWLTQTRINTANGGALAKAMDYSLRRWAALSRYVERGDLPIDNNAIENAIRPIAIGKKNWLFAGSERAGKRAAAIQGLFATAKKNNLDPARWLTDALTKLPTWPNSRIDELLPFANYRFTETVAPIPAQ